MFSFLRYNARHHFYWNTRGQYVRRGPRINPADGMVYGGGTKSISFHEPIWLYKWRQRTFAFAGRQRCGRRNDMFALNHNDGTQPDTWDWGPDGNRTCSYCGSLHPEDFMKIAKLSIEDERYGIDGTDKGYKYYVRQPGVRNAGDGGIKFYMQHAPEKVTDEEQRTFKEALKVSRERCDKRWNIPKPAA